MPQPIPISKTKIVIPNRRPELLSRSRLLESLTSLLDNKLILISAPAGYGKTSLMIDLAHHVKMPVCWLSLDLLDRDPQRFIAYLIASLAERFPNVGGTSRVQLNQLKSIEKDAEALLVTLTNEIYDHVEEDFLLIIDDYHLLDDVPVISALVNRFLELVMENCHIILSSRTLPSLANVTIMVAREQVAGLSHAELEFLPREVQALYAQNFHQHLSDEAAQEFVTQTGGWITGMVLSNLPDLPRISGVDTFAYLGQQVLAQQPQHIREFLMRTSLPEEFNAEFCEIVLGPLHSDRPSWYDLMGFILEKNLFVLPLDQDGRWLRYHPLLREFLQTRLKEERPHEVRPILERMVTAYEKAGEWEKAYFTCKQLNDVEALADVVERAGTPMLLRAFVTLEGWLNSLPPAMLQTRPGLISLRGPIMAVKGNLSESKELLDKAVYIYRKQKNMTGLILALVRRANTLRFFGDYTASLTDVQEALSLTVSDISLQLYYAEALRIKGLDLYRLGESRQAVESLEHSLSLFSAMNEPGRISILLMETGMVHGAVGDTESARNSYQRALKLKQAENDFYTQAEILNNLAVLYHQIGEYELASETFEAGLVNARKSRNHRAESLILAGLGDLYGEVGEFDAALQAYTQAELAIENLPGLFITNYLVVAKGNLALAQGNIDGAAQILKAFRKKMKVNQSSYERGLWELFEGRYYLLKDEPRKAIVLLKECRESFARDGRDLELQLSMLWLTVAYEQAGDRARARALFQELLSINSMPDHALLVMLCQTVSWLKDLQSDTVVGRQLGGWLEKSQRLNTKLPAIRRMLRRNASFVQVQSAGLVVRAFGNPEISVNGTVLQMSDWRTQSVRDLFLYFLYRQDAVTKEQVGATLWPETRDTQSLKARFKNEIYRLRRAAGRDVIVFDDEYYRFNYQMDYEYDVEGFDSHIQRSRKSSDVKARIEHLQKAVDLVHGPYLADVASDWPIHERERLKQAYSSALEELASLCLNTNQLDRCLALCQTAINQNRYHEMIYQIEMRVYAVRGDRPAIARCYKAYKDAMHDLGIPSSGETDQLYRELTG
ncbi:MAG: tetratricopeptide repeat protein [Anaerolineales bacterium]|nr:tetratricopeptide repeat protein [Anaerolineales bacterium]